MIRILVVEDDPSIRKALSMGLSSAQWSVDTAADGRLGLAFAGRREYDVLICDLGLPDMEGFEVIRCLKKTSPRIIPILITGRGTLESATQAAQLQVSDYLEKPLALETVKSAIHRGLKVLQEKGPSI